MNRRTFLSLLPSIPLVPRLLGDEMIQLPPPIININGVDWGVQPYVDWRESIMKTFPPIDFTKHHYVLKRKFSKAENKIE